MTLITAVRRKQDIYLNQFEPVSHCYSPVKRIDDNGNPTNEGRQIDCYIEESREVYELKLRVTIAASGQGRFSEEMSFPYEAR